MAKLGNPWHVQLICLARECISELSVALARAVGQVLVLPDSHQLVLAITSVEGSQQLCLRGALWDGAQVLLHASLAGILYNIHPQVLGSYRVTV